jgi:hypothetical protein
MQENNEDKAYLDVEERQITEIQDESDDSLYSEQLLRSIIMSYEEHFNKQNDKTEIKYYLTLTTQKVPTKEGNKDVAYLRLAKGVRSKQAIIEDPNTPSELKLPEWKNSLVHTEGYVFKDIKEQINPSKRWKDYLFQSCIARLVGAGLEYAELLQRMKQTNFNELQSTEPKSNIEIVKEMPKPLTPAEERYAAWIKAERAKEGL